ncbi:calcium-responsive transcription factor [Chanos chanos]|uniref:Calcium-responsive transcription factor n=1 Tax=Chanos chanos TaxID=29144 RepID=A0A6J2WD36_CHACN|nr:calcium-responsive transcription factor [Chanos chanos]
MEGKVNTVDASDGTNESKQPEFITVRLGTNERGPQTGSAEISHVEPKLEPEDQAVTSASPVAKRTEDIVIFDQNGQALQYERMVIVTGHAENGQLYVIPSNQLSGAQMLVPHVELLDVVDAAGGSVDKTSPEDLPTVTVATVNDSADSSALLTTQSVTSIKALPKSSSDVFVTPLKPLPPSAPNWALRLRDCEKIGDSYRGYCTTEAELEAVLLLHKQQTHSVFGTRQSPSPAKAATRLMWKSQYVPYDGIPFVNAGSRAIVMECQFGPRRKGLPSKKGVEHETNQNGSYKATCPARIYIKKVRKFPEYGVPTDPKVDKKVVRQEQEKAFFNLKKGLWDAGGVIRYYVQLPTQKAHLYHDVDSPVLPSPPEQPFVEEQENAEELTNQESSEREGREEESSTIPSRLHPLVAEKIKELVAQGHHQVYTVRKQLRRFVEREMFKSDEVPERHNLCYFPTVNDIKNHIHEAQKALQQTENPSPPPVSEWRRESTNLLTETVTLTLTPATVDVSMPRTGALEGSETLSSEAVQLFSSLSSLQPKIFAQLQGVQLQQAPIEELSLPQPMSAPDVLDSSSSLLPQPFLLSPTHFLQTSSSLGEPETLSVGVSTVTDGGASGGVAQIVLQDGQSIPVQIVDPASLALTSLGEEGQVTEKSEAEDTSSLSGTTAE